MTTRLPVLEDLRIATPCNADWDEMAGDARVRFCGKCEKNVYNLSEMPRTEAESLVREREGRLCVRFYQRQDGTVLTTDCPMGVRKKRLRQRVWASITSATASAMLVLGAWCGRARADLALHDGKQPHTSARLPMMGEPAPSPRPEVMGQLVAPPPQPPMMGKPTLPKPHKVNMGGPVERHFMGDVSPDYLNKK
jgi:hypothetical protein